MFDVKISDRIATVTLERAPVNAMNDEWTAGLHAILDDLAKTSDWSVLHFRSGLKLFSAGADLRQLKENFELSAEVQAEVGRRYQQLFARIEATPQPTIAEIRGAALGGGLELTLACDLRIAARDARMGLPEVGLGLIPGAGGTQRLTRLCGRAGAARMILGAEVVSGEEAYRMGLVQWCVGGDELAGAARAHAERIAALPRQALASAKLCIAAASGLPQRGFDVEVEQVRTLLDSTETKSLVRDFLNRQTR
jgi:enoyl-CoA hydratase/carnithine racemase